MTLAARIARLTGVQVTGLTRLHGGDLGTVTRVTLANGDLLVAKQGPLVETEARMLAALAPFAPEPLQVDGDLLLMQHLSEGPANWRHLGQILRQVHDRPGPQPGWDTDYAFGPVAIPNRTAPNWPAFWVDRRLRPFLPHLPADLARRLDALCTRLPDLLPDTPPRLLHGDLWTGNVHFSGGRGWLIDPACYYGDPEVDLAMLHLFGTPPPAFRDGYGPPRPGYADRQPLYQLWPALVHLRLFGAAYEPLVRRLIG
ncbi:fructosamine kinase family protein [Thalassovita sp.]|uniref:fructosamine kinase family protein n=1 Tax=Thalassovita sp. TaxID=1979401 RepID=UPI0029DE5A2A|nr:fructosamine kinase family protein [Thalassovita sp.]